MSPSHAAARSITRRCVKKFVVSTDGSGLSGLGRYQQGCACNQTDAGNSFKHIGSCPIHGSEGIADHGVSYAMALGVTGFCWRDVHCCDANHCCKRCNRKCNACSSRVDQVTVNNAGVVDGGDVGSSHWFELDCESNSLRRQPLVPGPQG